MNLKKIMLIAMLFFSFDVFASEQITALSEAIKLQEKQLQELKLRLIQLESDAQLKAVVPIEKDAGVRSDKSASDRTEKDAQWNRSSPKYSALNKSFNFKVRGKFQADIMNAHSNLEHLDYGNGSDIRRVRLGVQGSIDSTLDYVTEIEFSNKEVGFEDIFLRYRFNEQSAIRLGYHEASVSLDDETSDSDHSFLERSIHNSLSLGRAVGLGFETMGQTWSINVGLFGESGINDETGRNEDLQVSTRVMWTPFKTKNQTWHFGASGYYVKVSKDSEHRISARPENDQLAVLFDTGSHAANDTHYFGLESAFQHKNVIVQAEFGQQTVDYIDLAEANFESGYVQAAWIISGEQRTFNRARGKFGGITPAHSIEEGGQGALELAIRSSYMDLVSGDISGGKGSTTSIGLNWYPNASLRLSANWVHFDLDSSNEALPQGYSGHKGNALALRSQLSW